MARRQLRQQITHPAKLLSLVAPSSHSSHYSHTSHPAPRPPRCIGAGPPVCFRSLRLVSERCFMLTLVSWNVNGVRAAGRNGFLQWLDAISPNAKARAGAFASLLIAIVTLSLTGCISVSSHVPRNHPEDWGGYSPGTDYELIADVFLVGPYIKVDRKTGKKTVNTGSDHIALTPPRSFPIPFRTHSAPESFDAYAKDPVSSTTTEYETFTARTDVIAIIPKGTHIRCVRLDRTFEGSLLTGFGSVYDMWVEIRTGTKSGVLACITDLSGRPVDRNTGNYVGAPDPRILMRLCDNRPVGGAGKSSK